MWTRAWLFVVLVTAVLTGCGGNDDPSGVAANSTSESAGTAVLGTYTETLGAAPAELQGNPAGSWMLELRSPRAAYLVDPTGVRFPVGNPMKLSSAEMTFAADPECPTQEGSTTEGTYGWKLDGESLVLTETQDSCRDRAFVLTSEVWTLTEAAEASSPTTAGGV